MRDIHSRMNLSRLSVVASGLSGGEAQDASVVPGAKVVLGPVGSADALLVAVAMTKVSVDEMTNANTRLACMAPPY
jgi:hypothetical protein